MRVLAFIKRLTRQLPLRGPSSLGNLYLYLGGLQLMANLLLFHSKEIFIKLCM